MKDTLLKIMQHENHIVPQFPALKIISKESDDFRDMFLDEIWTKMLNNYHFLPFINPSNMFPVSLTNLDMGLVSFYNSIFIELSYIWRAYWEGCPKIGPAGMSNGPLGDTPPPRGNCPSVVLPIWLWSVTYWTPSLSYFSFIFPICDFYLTFSDSIFFLILLENFSAASSSRVNSALMMEGIAIICFLFP